MTVYVVKWQFRTSRTTKLKKIVRYNRITGIIITEIVITEVDCNNKIRDKKLYFNTVVKFLILLIEQNPFDQKNLFFNMSRVCGPQVKLFTILNVTREQKMILTFWFPPPVFFKSEFLVA